MEKELQDFIEICNITNQSDVTLISFGDAIKQILINTGGIPRGLIKQIIVYFQRKKLIFDEIVSPYYEIATRIDYAADNTKNFRPFSDMKEWKQLIIATKKQIAEDPVAGTRYHGARISIVAKNIKSFIAKGLKVKISLGGISFDPHDKIIHKEVSQIEKDIQNRNLFFLSFQHDKILHQMNNPHITIHMELHRIVPSHGYQWFLV